MTLRWDERAASGTRDAILRALEKAGDMALDMMLESLEGPKAGRTYRATFFTIDEGSDRIIVPFGNIPPHRASRARQAPATQTGELAASGFVRLNRRNKSVNVGFSAAHAKFLEFGTDKVSPRPFIAPVLKRMEKMLPKLVRQEIENL